MKAIENNLGQKKTLMEHQRVYSKLDHWIVNFPYKKSNNFLPLFPQFLKISEGSSYFAQLKYLLCINPPNNFQPLHFHACF